MSPLDRDDLRARVQATVEAELAHQRDVLAELDEDLGPLLDPVEQLLAGGKRLRAAFAYWGYRAAGHPSSDALVRLATAMELFQAAALLHDDVMDRSDTRRGMPSAHRAVAGVHAARGWHGDADRFGEATATLAGDLCLQWTDELYSTSGLPAEHLVRGRATFDRMRTQLMGGQFLDLLESVRGWDGLGYAERLAGARRVVRFKSAKYTIEQPLLIGAQAGGVSAATVGPLSHYGLALGEAFQLRDDLLGVFGDPERTGKPAGDDLREGKRTVLIAQVLQLAGPAERDAIEQALGRADLDDADISRLRGILTDSGAVDEVERDITRLADAARHALGAAPGLDPEAAVVLDELVDVCTARDS
ncbi:MAG TPA: polyprenyl synthetase family protein [Dermatophilaceae bacterium]|nr:polyprenyl synthetase family protein [Dermatophilaceae bacterium]